MIQTKNFKSIALMLFSTFCYASMGVLVKFASSVLPSIEIVFWRSFIVTIFIFTNILIKNRFNNVNNSELKLIEAVQPIFKKPFLLTRGLTGAIGLLFYFESIAQIKMSEALMLCYGYPVFTTIFSLFFLKERITVFFIINLGIAILGLAFISKPSFNYMEPGMVYGILAAFFSGASIVMVKKANQDYSTEQIVLSFTLLSTLITVPVLFIQVTPFSFTTFFLLLAIALSTYLGQHSMTEAYKTLEATTGSVLSLIAVVEGILFGFLFFSELPDVYSLLGGVLIILSGVQLALGQRVWLWLKRKKAITET